MTIYGKGCISNYRNCSLCYVWYSVLYRMLTPVYAVRYEKYMQPAAPAGIWIYSLLQSVFGIVSCTLRGVIIGNMLVSGYCNKPVFSHTIFHTLPVSVYPVF